MSVEQGLIGGELMGEHTVRVLNPEGFIERWTEQAKTLGFTYTRHAVGPDHSVFTLYSDGNAFLWIWS